jgi:hypothetical protein
MMLVSPNQPVSRSMGKPHLNGFVGTIELEVTLDLVHEQEQYFPRGELVEGLRARSSAIMEIRYFSVLVGVVLPAIRILDIFPFLVQPSRITPFSHREIVTRKGEISRREAGRSSNPYPTP